MWFEPDSYRAWAAGEVSAVASQDAPTDPVKRGEWLFSNPDLTPACNTCHSIKPGERLVGPSMADVYGRPGEFLNPADNIDKKDENYIRESILQPMKKIVATHPPTMVPVYGKLPEEDIQALIAYIKSLAPQDRR